MCTVKGRISVLLIVLLIVLSALVACSIALSVRIPPEIEKQMSDKDQQQSEAQQMISPEPEEIILTEQEITTPRKISLSEKQHKTELRPLGVIDDVRYLGINNDGELRFTSVSGTGGIVEIRYIQGQDYGLSDTTDLDNVVVEVTTEILYYN